MKKNLIAAALLGLALTAHAATEADLKTQNLAKLNAL